MHSRLELALSGLLRLLSGLVLMALLLFVPAGTTAFPGAWRMPVLLFVPMLLIGTCMLLRAPELLRKRLRAHEQEREQRIIVLLSGLMFTLSFVLCGVDHRLGLTRLPAWLIITACIVFLLSYLGVAEVFRENAFLSRTVELQKDQQVIDTGLYGIVRHPMYLFILFLFLSMPVVIGSLLGLIPLLPLPAVPVGRILNEERVLCEGLPGYRAYTRRVRYRLLPYIW